MSDVDVRIFDNRGGWIEPDTTGLSDDDIALIGAVRSAYENERTAADAVKQSKDRLAGFVGQLADAQNYLREHFPAPTFMDLWRQTTGKAEGK